MINVFISFFWFYVKCNGKGKKRVFGWGEKGKFEGGSGETLPAEERKKKKKKGPVYKDYTSIHSENIVY